VTARDALAVIRERAEAATVGPWEGSCVYVDMSTHEHEYGVITASHGDTVCDLPWRKDDFEAPHGTDAADAEFIAHARTDAPALVKALEAVLAIHQPEWTSDHHGGGFYRCSADDWTLDDETPACPTVSAIETALGER
jgi:hypothetical protein